MARVDHEERRRQIATAVWTLLEHGGLERASVRAVVAQTGLSSGSVRHFFSTQAGLHAFAMESLADRVRDRIAAASTAETEPAERALAMVCELLPLRDDTERELRVWLAFVARARHDERLAKILHDHATAVRGFLGTVVTGLRELGLRPGGADLDGDVRHLNAVVDGLALELLTAPRVLSRDQALSVVQGALLPIPPTDGGPR